MQNSIQKNAGLLIFLGSMGILFILAGVSDSEGLKSSVYIIIGIVFIGAVIGLLVIFNKKNKEEQNKHYQNLLYDYLAKNDNKISVIDFAKISGLPPDKAREIIENIAIKTGITPEINDEGRIIYKF